MPNHCHNTLTLQGSPEFIQTIINTQFSFKTLIPLEDYSIDSCIESWGTKWDCWDFNVIKKSNNMIIFECTTAWSPPIKILYMLVDKCDAWIKCQWHEEGGLAGIIVGDNKEVKELIWEDMCIEEMAS